MATTNDIVLFMSAAENPSGTASNKLQLNFNSPLRLNKAQVALTSLNLDFSFFNVSTALDNRSFSYVVDSKSYDVKLDEGNYDLDAINSFLETEMYNNGHYLINADGDYVYYINIRANEYTQRCAVTCTLVPASLPTNWSDPEGFLLIGTLKGHTLQLTVPDTGFADLLGYTAGNYPSTAGTATYNVSGDVVAGLDPISSILVRCNLGNTSYTNKSHDIIYAMPSPYDSSFGTVVNSPIYFPQFIRCNDGTFNSVILEFVDQNFNAISFIQQRHVASVVIRQ